MNVKTTVEIDRDTHSIYAECEAEISKHFGQLEVSDFFCDVKLTPDEIEICHDALIEKARHDCGLCIPEEEPDAKRYSR